MRGIFTGIYAHVLTSYKYTVIKFTGYVETIQEKNIMLFTIQHPVYVQPIGSSVSPGTMKIFSKNTMNPFEMMSLILRLQRWSISITAFVLMPTEVNLLRKNSYQILKPI